MQAASEDAESLHAVGQRFAMQRWASEIGVTQRDLERAGDDHDTVALIRAGLKNLNARKLGKMADELGVPEDMQEEADEADEPQAAFIELIVNQIIQTQQPQSPPRESAATDLPVELVSSQANGKRQNLNLAGGASSPDEGSHDWTGRDTVTRALESLAQVIEQETAQADGAYADEESHEWTARDSFTLELESLAQVIEEEMTAESCNAADAASNRCRMERVLECSVLDQSTLQQLDVEVFSTVGLCWVNAKITEVHVESLTVDVTFMEPQCGQYCQKDVCIVDAGRFRCAAFSTQLSRQYSDTGISPRLRTSSRANAVFGDVTSPRARKVSVPNSPTNLLAIGPDQVSRVTVTWTVPRSSEEERANLCELDWANSWFMGSWNTVTGITANDRNEWRVELQHNNLQAGNTLVLRVRARNKYGWSAFSNKLTLKLGTDGQADAEEGPDTLSTLTRTMSTLDPVERIPIVERIFGPETNEDSIRGQQVEIFHEDGGGWTAGTITHLTMDDDMVKVRVEFTPIQIMEQARLCAQSPCDPSLEHVWVTRDQGNIARFYREGPATVGQDNSPFCALLIETTRAQEARHFGQHAFRLISDNTAPISFAPAQSIDDRKWVEVQLNDCGDQLRIMRKTRPSINLTLSSDSEENVESWQEALATTPLAPILHNMADELMQCPTLMSGLFPESASEPCSHMHGKCTLSRTIACEGGEYFVTLSNSVLYFHQVIGSTRVPEEFDKDRRLSLLPISVQHADSSFFVRCEDCKAVNRTPYSASVILQCMPDGCGEVELELTVEDTTEALQWQVGIQEAIARRTETVAETLLQPVLQNRRAEFEDKAAAREGVMKVDSARKMTALRQRLQNVERPRKLIEDTSKRKECLACTTISDDGCSVALPPFTVDDDVEGFSAEEKRDFMQILGVDPSLCAGLQVEVHVIDDDDDDDDDDRTGRWVAGVVVCAVSRSKEDMQGTYVLVSYGSNPFIHKLFNIQDLASFRLPVVDPPQLKFELDLESELEPEPERPTSRQESDIEEGVPPEVDTPAMVRQIFGSRHDKMPQVTTSTTDIRDMTIEVFSSSSRVWLPATITEYDLTVGTLTVEYTVPANKCGSRCAAGRRRKMISLISERGRAKQTLGRNLRLRPQSGYPNYKDSWPVKQGWVMRQRPPIKNGDWQECRVTLYSDGHLTFHCAGEDESRSPAEPGHIVISRPRTERKDHPSSLRLDFEYDDDTEGPPKWKEVVDPKDDGTKKLLLQSKFMQKYPPVHLCSRCTECLSLSATLSSPTSLLKLQENALHDIKEVDHLLSEGCKDACRTMLQKWAPGRSDRARGRDPHEKLVCDLRSKMALWIRDRALMGYRPVKLADPHCPNEIMICSIANMLEKAHGIKALLCCDDMLQLVSSACGNSSLATQHKVFQDVRKLSQRPNARLSLVEAVVYMDPSECNLQCLEAELRDPRYKCYYIVFAGHRDVRGSAWAEKGWSMQRLVEADRFSLIRNVDLSFTGLFPTAHDMFVLEGQHDRQPSSELHQISSELHQMKFSQLYDRVCNAGVDQETTWRQFDSAATKEAMEEAMIAMVQQQQRKQRLLGALLCFGKPTMVRYSALSTLAHSLAGFICEHASRDGYAKEHWTALESAVGAHASSTLLIVDRLDDIVTPLIAPVTYQATIHELFQLERNTVRIPSAESAGASKLLSLRIADDEFWSKYAGQKCSDVSTAARDLSRTIDGLEAQACDSSKTARDRIWATYEVGRLKPIAATHLQICVALAPYFETLTKTAKLQQSLMDPNDRNFSAHLSEVRELLSFFDDVSADTVVPTGATRRVCRLRVLLLFALQYQEELWSCQAGRPAFGQPSSRGKAFLELCDGGRERSIVQRYTEVARDHGAKVQRQAVEQAMKETQQQLQGKEFDSFGPFSDRPVRPRLAHTLSQLHEDRYLTECYPRAHSLSDGAAGVAHAVTVFMAGGVTFEEGRFVHALNELNRQRGVRLRVSLGGDYVTTADHFLSSLDEQ